MARVSLTSAAARLRAVAPVNPPLSWFDLPGEHLAPPYDVVIEDDGRVHGYPAATWDACHLSFPDACVTPPSSATGYGYFKIGTVRTEEGTLVETGPLLLRGGHADPSWGAEMAMNFYDETDAAFADVAIGEDQHGIWIAGALRPDTTPEQVRTAMASGFSGDWRYIDGSYELIALSAVNIPGYRHHVGIYEQDGLVASMIVGLPRADVLAASADEPTADEPSESESSESAVEGEPAAEVDAADEPETETDASAETGAETGAAVEDADAVALSAVKRIAASIGRTPEQRIAELRERVHGEKVEVS